MASTLLFHGPGALSAALAEAHRLGRLVAPPIGKDGLRVADARAAVTLINSTPIGMELGVIIIGPMELALPDASNVLLKTLEEFPGVVQPLLWATDLGGVLPTIRSRCLVHWAPQQERVENDELEGAARDVVHAALKGQAWRIPPLVQKFVKDTKEEKKARNKKSDEDESERVSDMSDFIGSVAEALLADGSPAAFGLWEQVRVVAMYHNPTPIEIITALLPHAT